MVCTAVYLKHGHRTLTMMAPLLVTSGLPEDESWLHSNLFVFVCVKGCMQGTVWIEPDKCESMLHMEGQAWYVGGVGWWSVCSDELRFVCLFVVVLRHSNSISVISWQ